MIVVIADDFTGAAELAGIGLEHGLSVDIAIEQVDSSPETEMLVLATDTRSKGSGEAVDELRALSTYLKSIPYSFLYKKVEAAKINSGWEDSGCKYRHGADAWFSGPRDNSEN